MTKQQKRNNATKMGKCEVDVIGRFNLKDTKKSNDCVVHKPNHLPNKENF